MNQIYPSRNGYTLLLTVLVVGTMASATSIALILLGMSVERSSYSMQLSSQAFNGAWACVENAIASLQADLEYDGNERREYTYAYDENGSIEYGITECTIYPIGGTENEDRTICTEATFGNFTTRRLEVHLDRVIPGAVVNSWEEVTTIESCNPFTGPPPADCGNSSDPLDAGEECDDGNTRNNDGCSSVCQIEECGDGIQQAGEQCDDGATDPGDGCDELCKSEICGDMIIAASEECDDGNTENNDGCSSVCMDEFCGDGILQDDEECDDPDPNLCNADCTLVPVVTPSPDDYIGYWKLDETNLTANVEDSSVNSANGDPENNVNINLSDKATLDIALNNIASRDFDGDDHHIYFDGNSSHLFPETMTVSFWVKSDDEDPGPRDGIVCKTDSTNWTKGWGFYFNDDEEITFFIQKYWRNKARASINPTAWNHIAGTYDQDGGTDNIRIYVNGIEGSSDSYGGSIDASKKFTIGGCGDKKHGNVGAEELNINGKIDDVRIYERVLTVDQIVALASGN